MPLYLRDSTYYLHTYIGGTFHRISLKTKTRRIAEVKAADLLKKLHDSALPPALRKVKTKDALADYLLDCQQRLRANHYDKKIRRLGRLIPLLQAPLIKDLRTEIISKVLNRLAKDRGWSPVSYNHHRNDLNTFLNWCIDRGMVIDNPVKPIKPRKITRNPIDYLSQKDIRKILERYKGHWALPAVALAIYAGLRKGEIGSLRWEDIDFKARTITIKNRAGFTTKSGTFRIIPLSKVLEGILRPYKAPTGRVVTRKDLYRALHPWRKGKQNWNWLVFRHTFGTQCALAGVPAAKLKDWMGHHSITVTEKYYIGSQMGYDSDIEKLSQFATHPKT